MMFMPNTLSTGKAAKLLGVSVKTLQRWDREGGLIPVAKGTKRRLLAETQVGKQTRRGRKETLRTMAVC